MINVNNTPTINEVRYYIKSLFRGICSLLWDKFFCIFLFFSKSVLVNFERPVDVEDYKGVQVVSTLNANIVQVFCGTNIEYWVKFKKPFCGMQSMGINQDEYRLTKLLGYWHFQKRGDALKFVILSRLSSYKLYSSNKVFGRYETAPIPGFFKW